LLGPFFRDDWGHRGSPIEKIMAWLIMAFILESRLFKVDLIILSTEGEGFIPIVWH